MQETKDLSDNADLSSKSSSGTTKSSPTKKDLDIVAQALNHFAQGKRHLLVNDITSAVNSLQEACRLLGEHYGETAQECGDAYFYYGKALLELARIENGVLGNALDGVPEGEDQNNSQVEDPAKMTEEEVEMVAEIVDEALEENFKINEGKSTTNGNSETEDKAAEESVSSTKKDESSAINLDEDKDQVKAADPESIEEHKSKDDKKQDHVEELTNGKTVDGQHDPEMTDADKNKEKPVNEEPEPIEDDKSKDDKKQDHVEELTNGKAVNGQQDSEMTADADENKEEKPVEEQAEPGDSSTKSTKEGEDTMDTDANENGESAQEEEEDNENVDGEGNGTDNAEGEGEGNGTDEAEADGGDAEPEGDKTEDSEDDVDNLQLSWEMLELSKLIYEKQLESKEDSNVSLKLAQVFLKLGEVGLESENYIQSVQDFEQCLKIQKKELNPDDRRLAETYYQIGAAYSCSTEYDKSIESFEAAAQVVEQRISNLIKIREEKSKWTEEEKQQDAAKQTDPFYSEQTEIDELAKLLPEIKEKVSDMREVEKDAKEKFQKTKEDTLALLFGDRKNQNSSEIASTSSESAFSSASFSNSDESKPASDIGHLIKKKRKPEEPAAVIEVKRAKEDVNAKKELKQNGEQAKEVSCVDEKMEEAKPEAEEGVST